MSTTWNSATKGTSQTITGLKVSYTGSGNVGLTRAVNPYASVQLQYIEYVITSTSGAEELGIGLANASENSSTSWLGSSTGYGYQPDTGKVYTAGAAVTTLATAAATHVVSFIWDPVNAKGYWRTDNGNWNNSGTANPLTNTGGIAIGTTGPLFPCVSPTDTTSSVTARFSRASWTQTVPAGCIEVFPPKFFGAAFGRRMSGLLVPRPRRLIVPGFAL